MPVETAVHLEPITATTMASVAQFLHSQMNSRVSTESWYNALGVSWGAKPPNHGFLLRSGEEVVGAYVAIYSDRCIDGRNERFCNLAAWCVLERYRSHSVRLLRALVAQKGYHFTDLSPSGSVLAVNKRLHFRSLDTTTALTANVPIPLWSRHVKVSSDPALIKASLTGRDLDVFLNHQSLAAARHILITRGGEHCYVIVRRDRRKNLPLFASILFVSNRLVFQRTAPHLFRHLLIHHGLPATLVELRVVGMRPKLAITLGSSRPKMYRSRTLEPEQIDYLYSELMCVSW